VRILTAELQEWLLEAQKTGFIGPKPVETVYNHAVGFAESIDLILKAELIPPSFFVADLGSGAGVPGIFLAHWFPEARFVLIDSMMKRGLFLHRMVSQLGLDDRVEVYCGRSETFAEANRGKFDLVTARGFATPSVAAENASGLLRVGGVLLVSEPPGSDLSRWSRDGLAKLGFSPPELVKSEFSYSWMIRDRKSSAKFPRGVGIPEKSPIF
jgi:16S rRNA (guanine527-N7)-methyltransferase